jgi:ureidoacrylate peracid hydrolase
VFETDLQEHLQRLGTTHLVIAGMTANLCCESTGRRATEKGFDVSFLADAIGSENLLSYEAAVKINYPLIGNAVFKVEDFLAALESAENNASIELGNIVCGSDGGEIGEISELVEANQDHPGYMVVPRGILFEKDTYIPLNAVTKLAGKKVFINLPKMVVGKMEWNNPPTFSAEHEKHGPRAAEVEKLYLSHSPSGGL